MWTRWLIQQEQGVSRDVLDSTNPSQLPTITRSIVIAISGADSRFLYTHDDGELEVEAFQGDSQTILPATIESYSRYW